MASEKEASNIEIYLRMRPISGIPAHYEIDQEESMVQWHVPRQIAAGMANHQRERYDFFFTGIFNTDSKQDIVFEKVAQKVVLGALDGYNGTVFAYGQTGSGKTFSITGGAERYVDRGIIPRAISLIYSELGRRSDYTYTLHFSYLEIYNETGIDLLNPEHDTKSLEDLPKVALLEDEENFIHLRNLSSHLATNEEEALNLLFVGDTNRMISATPMNMASSRSHCIFTVTIEARKAGEDTVRKSKLHLVDLAGSERVSKTGVDGQILKEAKYINLSLHFLEQVIVALQERSQGKPRQHIPYRNSMMTSVLRDSLGGNCQTVMLATVSIAQDQLEETISTCRFAQRVATISNRALLNEEVDPNLVIRRLKQEIKELKMEIQLLRGGCEEEQVLNERQIKTLQDQVTDYVNDRSCEASLSFGASVLHIKAIFQLFKDMIISSQSGNFECGNHASALTEAQKTISAHHDTIRDLSQLIQEKDNEISVLVSFIRKHNHRPSIHDSQGEIVKEVICKENKNSPPITDSTYNKDLQNKEDTSVCVSSNGPKHLATRDASFDKAEAFNVFQRSNPRSQTIEDNRALLRDKYQEAKGISECVNKARENIIRLKSQIQKRRIEHAMQGIRGGVLKDEVRMPDSEEDQLVSEIEVEKKKYKEGFNKLRDFKKEIEQLHHLLELSQSKIQEDFQRWISVMNKVEGISTNQENLLSGHPTSDLDRSGLPTNRSCQQETEPNIILKRRATLASENSTDQACRWDDEVIQTSQDKCIAAASPSSPSNVDGQQNTARGVGKQKRGVDLKPTLALPEKNNIPVTGNAKADADIAAFYKARDKILKLRTEQGD